MPARARARIASSAGASDVLVSAKSLRIAKWMQGSRLPRASTSTCSSSGSTPAAVVSIVGTITIVRAVSGTPLEKSRRGSRFGGTSRTTTRWTQRNREVARRQQDEQRDRRSAADGPLPVYPA